MTKPLPRVDPASSGVDPASLDRLFRAFDGLRDVHGAIVLHRGAVVAEGWWHPYSAEQPHALFSVSKSFTSTAVGIAIAEGRLSLDDLVVDLLPDDAPERPGANLAAMRVRHLLTMTTGHDDDTMAAAEADPDGWARGILSAPVPHEPGSRFVYNSGATYLLSAILQRLTGERLVDYLAPRLFEPLGISHAVWERSPEGIDAGGFGLSLTTEDLALFGQLLLARGRWGDRQLVPAEWVVAATSAQVPNGSHASIDSVQGYGFQFWRCRFGAFRADGAFGQFVVVWPEPGLVFAITGGVPDTQAVLDAIWAAFPEYARRKPGIRRGTPAAPEASKLDLARLCIPTIEGAESSPIEAEIRDRSFAIDENPLGIASVSIGRDDDGRLTFSLSGERAAFTVPAGHGVWAPGSAPSGGSVGPAAASAAWVDDRTLVVRIVSIPTPFSKTFTLAFDADGDALSLTLDRNVSFGRTRLVEARGRAAEQRAPSVG